MANEQIPNGFTFTTPPPVVGTYWIGGVSVGVGFTLSRRPRWLHRVAMRYVFGWEWRDAVAPLKRDED